MAQKRRRTVGCVNTDVFMADFGAQITPQRPKPEALICALCFIPLQRITAIFGQLFQTIIHLTVIDSNGLPVGMDVPKYVKAHLCERCFKANEGVIVKPTPYFSFTAISVKSGESLDISFGRKGRGHRKDDEIPTTQTIDPHDDKIDAKGADYVLRGGAKVSPEPGNYLYWKANRHVRKTSRSGGLSPSIGRNVPPETVTLKDSPSTKRFRDMVEELKRK